MASTQDDAPLLLIRCPTCGQRFKVSADLRDRTVECGSCEHRFRINDDVTLRSRKFYPRPHPEVMASRYQRVPMAAPIPENWQTAVYESNPDPFSFEPVSPQRLIAGAAGSVGMILMAMLLFFGASRGGALDGMATVNRLMMAGFTVVVATVLLVYANPRSRIKALLGSLLCGAGLITIPVIFTDGSTPLKAVENTEETARKPHAPPQTTKEQDRIAALRQSIGTDPLTSEITRLAAEHSGKHAYGLWLRGLTESNKLLVRDYLLRVAEADSSSHPFPRGHNDYLMVVTGVDMIIEKLAELVAPLGEVTQIYREIDVIEVRVNNGNFMPVPIEKLTDKENPSFYELNKRELDSIDLQRVQAAVKRLAEVEPTLFRKDITAKLISLLKQDGVEFKDSLCKALLRWSDGNDGAGDAAEAVLRKLYAKKVRIPTDLTALLVKAKQTTAIPILDALWFDDPTLWEQYYVAMGSPIEPTLIRRFPQTSGGVRNSVVHMLAKVGGRDSLPLLKAARENAEPELRIRIDAAEKAIKERLGQ